jgi:hypothetical protein
MKFKLKIDCGNVAFEDDATGEVARILRSLADRLEQGMAASFRLHDFKGNKVGTAVFKGDKG